MKFIRLVFSCLILVVCLCGCDSGETKKSESHPILHKADLFRAKRNYKEAIKYYKKYLELNPKSGYIHLKLASIYDENLKDPYSAIYHYREFLELSRNEQEKNEVKLWIELCERRVVSEKQKLSLVELPKNTDNLPARTPQIELQPKTPSVAKEVVPAKVEEQIVKTEEKVTQIQVVQQTPAPKTIEVPPAPPQKVVEEIKKVEEPKKVSTPVAENEKDEFPKEYIIKRGDTLSGISKKFYGTTRHYKKIMQANNIVRANDLKIGKKIIIPKID